MFFSISGCRLWCTGQVWAVCSKIFRCLSETLAGSANVTSILAIRLGVVAMCFVTVAVAPSRSTPKARALMPITVSMQLARPVATVSVGEKASPFPWLSTGASVLYSLPEVRCRQLVRKLPSYVTFEVI